ncbi:MAG: hypothetical protein ACUVWV_16090 [Thermodesulfobacteriota bacterium]
MTLAVTLKAIIIWFLILWLAILNGVLREKVLIPAVGSFTGFVASGAILSICIFLVAFAAGPWYGLLTSRAWLLIGVFWLLLTLAFEFSFGRFAQHKSWADLLQAYTFRGGNIWPLVLLVTFISPWLAAKCRGFI